MQLQRAEQMRDYHWLALIVKLLERKLTARLRFSEGHVYSVDVSLFFAAEAPSRVGPVRGDIAVAFSCSPGKGAALGAVVVETLEALQVRPHTCAPAATAGPPCVRRRLQAACRRSGAAAACAASSPPPGGRAAFGAFR